MVVKFLTPIFSLQQFQLTLQTKMKIWKSKHLLTYFQLQEINILSEELILKWLGTI